MQIANIKYMLANNTQLSIRVVYPAIYYLLSTNYPFIATVTTNISYSQDLSNLAKIYTNNAKYSNCTDSFIFKLIIF